MTTSHPYGGLKEDLSVAPLETTAVVIDEPGSATSPYASQAVRTARFDNVAASTATVMTTAAHLQPDVDERTPRDHGSGTIRTEGRGGKVRRRPFTSTSAIDDYRLKKISTHMEVEQLRNMLNEIDRKQNLLCTSSGSASLSGLFAVKFRFFTRDRLNMRCVVSTPGFRSTRSGRERNCGRLRLLQTLCR